MSVYLDDLEKRMSEATSCAALTAAARDAMDSIQQGIDDAQAEVQKLAQLIIPPTTLPGVIIWIKAQIELYAPPYQAYLTQIASYTELLQKLQALLAEKAAALCQDTPE
jgi:hypothetical protein